jgi:2,5-diamino-6-(ribosylamino)-4(3H)-pyrimidinone 5'-phosphate reductase
MSDTPGRPSVALVLAMSLDGKIATTRRDPVTFTSRRDRERLHALRDRSDAILLGARTVRVEDLPLLPTAERAAMRTRAGLTRLPLRAVVSASLDLPTSGRALERRVGAPVVIFTTERAPAERRRVLEEEGVAVEVAGTERVDLERAVALLGSRYACRRVLAEGGGTLAFALFERDQVDEVYLTVCPVVIGGEAAPTAADGAGFTKEMIRRAELVEWSAGGEGEIFLKYAMRRG